MALNHTKLILKQGKTALLICDVQTKFSKAIFSFDNMVTNTSKLINAFKLMNVPMLVTEQMPQNLGTTVPEFDISGAEGPFSKSQFSMCTPEVNEALSKICSGKKPEAVVLAGIEAHVCIENTAIDLCAQGIQVHAAADCISARTLEDRILALNRMKEIGCVIATSENVIFKMLADAKHEQFKKILTLLRSPTSETGLVTSRL